MIIRSRSLYYQLTSFHQVDRCACILRVHYFRIHSFRTYDQCYSHTLEPLSYSHRCAMVPMFEINSINYFPLLSAPPRILSFSTNQTADLGSNVTLVCTVIGRPQPTIVWRKNGKVLFESQVTGNITLLNISQADDGFYECSVSNHLASESRTMELKVEG